MIRFHIRRLPAAPEPDIPHPLWEGAATCLSEYPMEDDTGNRILEVRSGQSGDAVYLSVRTAEELTPAEGDSWMRLYFTLPGHGKEYALGLGGYGERTGLYEKAGDRWSLLGPCDYAADGDILTVFIPPSLIPLPDRTRT